MVAGTADQIVQACAFSTEDNYHVGREVEAVVILCAALIEAYAPQAVFLQRFQRAHQIDDAGEAQMLGRARGGLDRNCAQGRGAALGDQNTIHSRSLGGAEQCAEVLGVFDTVQSKDETWLGPFEEVFDVQEIAFADDRDYTLVGCIGGEAGEGFPGFLTDFDSCFPTEGDNAREAFVMPLPSHADVVESPVSGPKRLLHGMEAKESFHQ